MGQQRSKQASTVYKQNLAQVQYDDETSKATTATTIPTSTWNVVLDDDGIHDIYNCNYVVFHHRVQ